MNYLLNQEDKEFLGLIKSNDFFLHSLLPNQTNIFPLLYIDANYYILYLNIYGVKKNYLLLKKLIFQETPNNY